MLVVSLTCFASVASRMTWLCEISPFVCACVLGPRSAGFNVFILCSFFCKKFLFPKDNCILSAWDNHTPRRELQILSRELLISASMIFRQGKPSTSAKLGTYVTAILNGLLNSVMEMMTTFLDLYNTSWIVVQQSIASMILPYFILSIQTHKYLTSGWQMEHFQRLWLLEPYVLACKILKANQKFLNSKMHCMCPV